MTFKTVETRFLFDTTTQVSTPIGDFEYTWHPTGDNQLTVEKIKIEDNIHETVVYTADENYLKIVQSTEQDSVVFFFAPKQ